MKQRLIGESQEEYCKGCECLCNVMLKDGETCGDRVEKSADGHRYVHVNREECPV